jgi:antitoxin PrlF
LIVTNPTYPLAPATIGNASSFCLTASFYRDHPQFVNATGWVEVLSDNTVLVRLEAQPVESDSDDLMLSIFLDLVTKDALTNPEHLEAYTEEMTNF